jgi:hypothetical protein
MYAMQSASALELPFDDGLNRWLALQNDAGDPDIEPEYPSEWKEGRVQGPEPLKVDDIEEAGKSAPVVTEQWSFGLPQGFRAADVTYAGNVAPVEEHFPYLTYRPMSENFRYTRGKSFERANPSQPGVGSPARDIDPPSGGQKKGRISRFFDRVTGRTSQRPEKRKMVVYRP